MEASAAWVRDGASRDATAWERALRLGSDPSALAGEHNVVRHGPVATPVRWGGSDARADADALMRAVAASLTVTGAATVSSLDALPAALGSRLDEAGVTRVVEDAASAVKRAREHGRLRIIGAVEPGVRGHADVAVYSAAPTASWLDVLPFVREQAVSITAHRYGTPHPPSGRIGAALLAGEVGIARG
ncbi:hypothetical protein [Demequina litorisediminis]|uniref:hypothetical protein n=1 Tax=Demequina litorisediminis TaxID=1849022 RepID=UPI0024E0F4A3|nr:hypothetical protein [Demequina litorisediminis]